MSTMTPTEPGTPVLARLRGFHPGWYGAVMGTAIVGIVAYQDPGRIAGLHDSMQSFGVLMDYGTQQITAAASVDQLEHIDGAIALPFTINEANKLSPTPHLTIGIGDGTIEAIVDTGGGIPLTIGPEDLAKVGVEVPADAPAFAALSAGAAGAFESVGQAIRVPVTLGDTELSVPVTVVAGMAPGAGANIGHAFLDGGVGTRPG